MMEELSEKCEDRHYCSVLIPIVLLVLSLLVTAGFQTYALLQERASINAALTKQKPVIEQAKKMRTQLDSIARRTAVLAQEGNPNAQTLVEELKKAGITINPNVPQGQ